jgi:dihydrofolate reductase
MGRVTYEGWAGFWPKLDGPIAGALNDIPKVVFPRTLFTGLGHPLTLRLLASRAFSNGLLELVYSPS